MQDYTLLRFLESAPGSPLHFVLPKRFRKLFYRKGVPFFGLRIGISVALAIIIAASVLLFLKPIKTLYINEKGYWEANYGDGIIMVYIPEGGFTMGSAKGESDEKPEHEVYLDGYWMGKYEVTFAQYDKYCEDAKKDKPDDEGWGRVKRPVINVSWEDANAYCKWLSDKKGLNFKLPTEAQWEKAARGTDVRKYPWGDHDPYYNGKWYANYAAHDSWEKRGEDGFEYTAPVGSYPQGASPYGLLDMAGNVWEWCYDWYDIYSAEPQKNPKGPESGTLRVVRGGSWDHDAVYLRCAYRYLDGPSYRYDYLGFRLCQDNR
jgi:formylglycine-generating enzyme required for sulfatase activity